MVKKFTVPCQFGQQTAPFDVYIGEPKEGNHPLQNQSKWLSSERGGTIPQEIMESFGNLLKLAAEKGVSFEELCVYALEVAEQQQGGGQEVPQPQQGQQAVPAPGGVPAASPSGGETS